MKMSSRPNVNRILKAAGPKRTSPRFSNPLPPVAPKFKKIPKHVASASNSRNEDTSPVVVSTLNSKSIAHSSEAPITKDPAASNLRILKAAGPKRTSPRFSNPLLPVAPKFKKIPKPVASASNSRNVDTSPVVVSTLNSKSIAHTSSWGKKFKRIHKKTFTSNFKNVMDSEVTSPVASSPLMDQTDEHEEAMSPVASSPLMDQTDEPNGLNNSTEPNPERSAPCESDVSRASNKVRGVSRGLKLDKLVKKYGKMKIVFNPSETIPVAYEHEFSEGIGVSIRTCSELIGANVWRDIPETNREVIHRCLMQWFEIEEWQTDRVKKIVNAKFQTSYRRWRHTLANCYLKLKEEGLDPKEKCPRDEVSMSKWHAVCDYIESGKFEDKSHKNSRSRSFLPYPHTGGRTSCLSRYKKMVQQSKIQLWRSNHVKKSGEFVNDAAKNTYEKMIEYETTSMEEGAEQMPEDDILVAALGRRSGYQKGMGYGVEVSRGTNSIAKTFELQAQLQSSNEKIENLTVQLGLQMEENKVNKEKITSLDAQLVENRKENESNKETINNLQEQMNQLMSIVNGLSASRNEGTLHRRK